MFVFKCKLSINPIKVSLRDHLNEELLKAMIDLGEVEIQFDHVYERKNIIKVLGLQVDRSTGIEQRKTDINLLRVFGKKVIQEMDNISDLMSRLVPPPPHQGKIIFS